MPQSPPSRPHNPFFSTFTILLALLRFVPQKNKKKKVYNRLSDQYGSLKSIINVLIKSGRATSTASVQRERKRCELTGFFHHHVTSISRNGGNISYKASQERLFERGPYNISLVSLVWESLVFFSPLFLITRQLTMLTFSLC